MHMDPRVHGNTGACYSLGPTWQHQSCFSTGMHDCSVASAMAKQSLAFDVLPFFACPVRMLEPQDGSLNWVSSYLTHEGACSHTLHHAPCTDVRSAASLPGHVSSLPVMYGRLTQAWHDDFYTLCHMTMSCLPRDSGT